MDKFEAGCCSVCRGEKWPFPSNNLRVRSTLGWWHHAGCGALCLGLQGLTQSRANWPSCESQGKLLDDEKGARKAANLCSQVSPVRPNY